MEEIWKPIKGYEGFYSVSNLGRVRSETRFISKLRCVVNGKTLSTKIERNGYERICLYKNGIGTFYSIHRLVATTFIQNPYNLPVINHKDENRKNNRVDNLEWCTHSYNINYGTRNKKISKPIVMMDDSFNIIREYESAKKASVDMGLFSTSITRVCKGRMNHCGGYRWKYK